MTDHDRLKVLADREEIRDLAQRFAVAITAGDAAVVADLFDPGADFGAAGAGSEGARAFYTELLEHSGRPAFVQIGAHQIDLLDDDTASGICLVRSSELDEQQGRSEVLVSYTDTYRKTGDRWRFVERIETVHDRATFPSAVTVST